MNNAGFKGPNKAMERKYMNIIILPYIQQTNSNLLKDLFRPFGFDMIRSHDTNTVRNIDPEEELTPIDFRVVEFPKAGIFTGKGLGYSGRFLLL